MTLLKYSTGFEDLMLILMCRGGVPPLDGAPARTLTNGGRREGLRVAIDVPSQNKAANDKANVHQVTQGNG